MPPPDEFLTVARLMGHDAARLADGAEVCTYGTFANMKDGAGRFIRATAVQRVERGKHFFNPPIALRSRLGQGVHDRAEASVFADHVLSDDDREKVAKRLPLYFKAVSVREKTVAPGEVWDLSVRGDCFGFDYEDLREFYVMANVETLLLQPGASVVIRGNIFSLLCQRVIAADSSAPYHIGILPTPFSVDQGFGEFHGSAGAAGAAGKHGSCGRAMCVAPTLLGHTLSEEICQHELHGEAGTNGNDGATGANGRNGGMCYVAELTIRDVRGDVDVFIQAGAGGNGGDGGHGGAGGNGGDGTRGYNVIRGLFHGGNGGRGGDGGKGGRGGHAGSGGIASNVYICVPPRCEPQIHAVSLPSDPGSPGLGGHPGAGGRGGNAGPGPRPDCDGVPGLNGAAGNSGFPGRPGRTRPAPLVFLNESPISSERMQYVSQVEFS